MKLVQLSAVYGVAAMALLLSVTSCKKSSSNSTKLGTVTFQLNGTPQTFTAEVDTTFGININAAGVVTGSHDTVSLTFSLQEPVGPYASQYIGYFSDTTNMSTVSLNYADATAGSVYTDNDNDANFLTANITTNGGGVIKGTFKGTLFLEIGSGADSLIVSNGSFDLQM
jgi:hypothetical protein